MFAESCQVNGRQSEREWKHRKMAIQISASNATRSQDVEVDINVANKEMGHAGKSNHVPSPIMDFTVPFAEYTNVLSVRRRMLGSLDPQPLTGNKQNAFCLAMWLWSEM